MRRICVFCGSKTGRNPLYRAAAEDLAQRMVERKLELVYGGGSVGLMGVIADTVLAAGGEVIGVIPQLLATKELLHPGVRQMHRMASMHERKAKMAELSDAFIAIPGGYGTLEELLEMITWAQLGIHRKPVGLLNVAGYFDSLVKLVDHAIAEGFIRPKNRELIVVGDRADQILDQLAAQKLSPAQKWLDLEQS